MRILILFLKYIIAYFPIKPITERTNVICDLFIASLFKYYDEVELGVISISA